MSGDGVMRTERTAITLLVDPGYPLEPGPPRAGVELADRLTAAGQRVEVIAESPDDEEFVHLDAAGRLVHRVSAARGYARKVLAPVMRDPLAVRMLEKALELEALWNRAFTTIELPSGWSDALLFRALVRRRKLRSAASVSWPRCNSISLICPTYNRVDELLPAIKSFLDESRAAAQRGIDHEVLIVFQNDGTPEKVLARRPEWREAPLRWIRSEPGLPRARNVGVAHARGDLLVFVDDDVVLDPGFLAGHLEAANAFPTSAGNAGRVRSRILGERGARNRAIGQLRLSAFIDTHFDSVTASPPIVPHTPIGANMAFKRAAITRLFGERWFDERITGSAHREETTLCVELFRRGGHLVFAPEASLLHLEAEAGGCENRGVLSPKKEIDHLALDYLFFRRFFRDLGPLAPVAPLAFFSREVRQSGQPKLTRAYLNARGYWAGLRRFRRFERGFSGG
jgi:GT2 family glycosyltransferase